MQPQPDSGETKPRPLLPWRWVWLAPLTVTLLAFFSFNWSRLPGPALPERVADEIFWWMGICLALLVLLAATAGIPLALTLLIVAIWQRHYRISLIRLAVAVLLAAAGVFVCDYTRWPGMETVACRWVAWRARPIVTALEEYREDQDRYPSSLAGLQPRYLRRIPTPALLGSDRFSYETAETPENRFSPSPGSYDLHVWFYGVSDVPSVHYRPEKRYPKHMGDGELAWRVGDWAYVWTEGAPP